jgi:choline kinase
MRVVLLAAGRASRLRPLTDTLPKCLLDVGGRSIVDRAIATLAEHGIGRFTVVDGFMGDQLRAALTASFPHEWFTFVRNQRWETTNNAYSLMLAQDACDEPLLLLDADIVFEPDVLRLLLSQDQPNRLALRTSGDWGEEEMKVTLDEHGRVTNIGKHIRPEEAAGESVGLEVFAPDTARKLFATLRRRMLMEGRVNEWYEATFAELVERGTKIDAIDLGTRKCLEIDTAEDLARARSAFG